MSDEPLYCPSCGKEIGIDCACTYDFEYDPAPPRERYYCECCGVIPASGKECKFYGYGGANTEGCES